MSVIKHNNLDYMLFNNNNSISYHFDNKVVLYFTQIHICLPHLQYLSQYFNC